MVAIRVRVVMRRVRVVIGYAECLHLRPLLARLRGGVLVSREVARSIAQTDYYVIVTVDIVTSSPAASLPPAQGGT